ncbi:unnamed protein product [Vitrella brassicaformis CCMP3155]|uniref:EGF-like domain-containing protein n=1 Tax=Vitrella brassicaformis (strain CCMP3155) TaxID=1169540 RepID=A0A0G4ELW7_VITBC|nr:unnamed protein product [Vitrella brassicaformis CCMP3155]|eukprot:CEL97962.1 unnamed protein product [Vitrella brassicaformis CCMP3155]
MSVLIDALLLGFFWLIPCGSSFRILPDQTCGEWCREAPEGALCFVDRNVHSCQGELCTTSCELWSINVLSGNKPRLPCGFFMQFQGFPIGSSPCRDECLPPEIRRDRYPQPLGEGLLCCDDRCEPAVAARHANFSNYMCGVLECPCNYFGSDCDDDFLAVDRLERVSYGPIQHLTLHLSLPHWDALMATYQPGGVTRVFVEGWHIEQAYAIANTGPPGVLEVLSQQVDESLHENVTVVARALRSMPAGRVRSVYVNPSIVGFVNSMQDPLMDFMSHPHNGKVQHLVFVSTGVGLSGVRATMELLERDGWFGTNLTTVSILHGARTFRDMPFRDHLLSWRDSLGVSVTIISSERERCSLDDVLCRDAVEAHIRYSQMRQTEGSYLAQGSEVHTVLRETDSAARVQHAAALEMGPGGRLADLGASFEDTVVVSCGRVGMVDSLPLLLDVSCRERVRKAGKGGSWVSRAFGGARKESSVCKDFGETRVFRNI